MNVIPYLQRARRAGCAVALMTVMSGSALAATGMQTRFEFIAVFPEETPAAALEDWRRQVLGRVHERGCLRELPCVGRLMRLALPQRAGREVFAFDLMPDVSPEESDAIVRASAEVIAGTQLLRQQRPADL